VKTTVELPEKLMRTAKKKAAARGQSFPEFVADAVADKIGMPLPKMSKTAAMAGEKPWMKHFGVSADLADEMKRIDKVVEEEFGKVDPDDWK